MWKIIVAMADMHSGHKLGLLNPDTRVHEQDEMGRVKKVKVKFTATQKWLWKMYRKDVQDVVELAGDDPIVLLVVGDACNGDKYPDQLVSTRRSDQIEIAVRNLDPWVELQNLDKLRLAKGTGAHDFGEGSAELLVAAQIQAKHEGLDVQVLWHGLGDADGVLIDYAHHGPSAGIRHWTSGNQVRYYLKSIMDTEIWANRRPPDVVLRAHYHNLCWETVKVRRGKGDEYTQAHAIILPAYCGMSDHGQQATQSKYLISCGLVAMEVVDGELMRIVPFARSMDLRTREKL